MRWTGGLLATLVALVATGCRVEPTDGAIANGRVLYQAYGCAACHGTEGRGDGVASRALYPKPRDLFDPSAFAQGGSVPEIAATIAGGVRRPGSGMAAFPHIPRDERLEIAAYVYSLRRKGKS